MAVQRKPMLVNFTSERLTRMSSAVAKGARYKAKTRRWLEQRGYQVVDLEIVRWVHTPRGRIPIKRDQLGSDLQAVSKAELIFIQVKGGKRGAQNLASARREFAKYVFPPFAKLWIIAWPFRAREPRVIDCDVDIAGGL